MLELVFLLPIIMVLLFVILDFAILIDRRGSLDHAVREGTRAAARGDSIAKSVQLAVDESRGLLTSGDVSVCYEDITGNGTAGNIGDNVKMTVTHTYNLVLGSEMLNFFSASTPTVTLRPVGQDKLEKEITVAPKC